MTDSSVQIQCSACQKVLTSVMKCSRCRSTLYCSRECQVKDWEDHKTSCGQDTSVVSKLELIVAKIRSQPLLVYELLNLLTNVLKERMDRLVSIKCLYDEASQEFELLDPEVISEESYYAMTGVEIEAKPMCLQIIMTDMSFNLMGCGSIPLTEITRSEDDQNDAIYSPIFDDDEERSFGSSGISTGSSSSESDSESNSGSVIESESD